MENKEHMQSFRVSDQEKQLLERRAHVAGLTASELIRRMTVDMLK